MPPFFRLSWDSLWCLDFNFAWMMMVVLGFFWSFFHVWMYYEQRNFYLVGLLVLFAIWVRLMVAVVARSAIHNGVEKCLKELRRRNIVLCVGFSWGAGVLSELLTREVGLDTRPAFVLIAPVSAATALAAMRDDAAVRMRPLDPNNTDGDLVQVIHASDDPVFCPHPERWDAVQGIQTCTLQDNHVFKNLSSRRAIGDIVTNLYRRKTQQLEGQP